MWELNLPTYLTVQRVTERFFTGNLCHASAWQHKPESPESLSWPIFGNPRWHKPCHCLRGIARLVNQHLYFYIFLWIHSSGAFLAEWDTLMPSRDSWGLDKFEKNTFDVSRAAQHTVHLVKEWSFSSIPRNAPNLQRVSYGHSIFKTYLRNKEEQDPTTAMPAIAFGRRAFLGGPVTQWRTVTHRSQSWFEALRAGPYHLVAAWQGHQTCPSKKTSSQPLAQWWIMWIGVSWRFMVFHGVSVNEKLTIWNSKLTVNSGGIPSTGRWRFLTHTESQSAGVYRKLDLLFFFHA